MSEPLISVVLPVDLKSQNTGRGNRWFNSARLRNQFEAELQDFCRPFLDVPIHLEYTRIVGPGQRAWDQDNLALALKQLQDALVSLGWFHDDSPRWIRSIRYSHDTTARDEGPALKVTAWAAD